MKKVLHLMVAGAISFMTLGTMTIPASAGETGQPDSRPYWSHVVVPTANVRSCASTGCRIVRKLHRGNAVHVYYRWGGWSNIGYGRWIASYLITR
jgi:hypothetical protein